MAQGYTAISYGNVRLYRCTTRNVSQREVLDASGTDLKYMETEISVTGQLNGHMPGTPVNTDGSPLPVWQYGLTDDNTGIDPGGIASVRQLQIRRQLPPRQTFFMFVGTGPTGTGGEVLLFATPAPSNMSPARPAGPGGVPAAVAAVNMNISNVDLANGPHCKSFVITRIFGDEHYEVEATFVISKLECDRYGNVPNNSNGILSNRWSCTDTLDANLRTNRVYTGQMCLTSANLSMQQLRWLILPPIIPMMRRDNMQITASEDGLIMNWSVTDIEIAMSAPYPARTWSVTHTESARFAMFGESHIEVDLTGDSNVNKSDLIELAFYIMTAKMFGSTPPNIGNPAGHPANFWNQFNVLNIELVDNIGDENRIHARMSVKKTMTAEMGFAIVGDVAQKFGSPLGASDVNTSSVVRDARPGYDRSMSWGGYAGDTPPYQSPAVSVVSIFAAYLQSPCNDQHQTALPPGTSADIYQNQLTKDLNQLTPPAKQVAYNATIVQSLAPADTTNPYASTNPLTTSNAYTFWQLENVYKNKTMKVAMPIAGSPPVSGPNYAPTVSVIGLGIGAAMRTLRVKAERINKEPQFPDGNAIPAPPMPSGGSCGQNILQWLIKWNLRAATPVFTPLGQKIYRAEAEYILALSRPPNPGEQLALGNDIWSILGSQTTNPDGTITKSDWR